VLKPPGDFAVYFARHGETIGNVQNRVQGRLDSALTEVGRKQAHQIALILHDFISMNPLPHFVSSPTGRARATMEIVLRALALPTDSYASDERLLEVDYGEWSGRSISEIEANDRERWEARERDKWNVSAPGGENYAMVATRAESWFSDLRDETVVIGHGSFWRVLRGLYSGLSWEEMSAIDEPQGVVFRLQQGTIARIEPPLLAQPFDDPATEP
jgi:broad specificity phosphatase PhoE